MSIASEIIDLNTNLANAKNAVVAKGGSVTDSGLAGLSSEIAGIPSGGASDDNYHAFYAGTSRNVYDNTITTLPTYFLAYADFAASQRGDTFSFPAATSAGDSVFYGVASSAASGRVIIDLPNLTTVGRQFMQNSRPVSVNLPKLTTAGDALFRQVRAGAEYKFSFPKLTSMGVNSFSNTSTVAWLDFGDMTANSLSCGSGCFGSTRNLSTVIFRYQQMVPFVSGMFSESLIASGTGYIYVPKSLVDTYKTDSGWSTYASQFRAIEDYSDDGTATGEITP